MVCSIRRRSQQFVHEVVAQCTSCFELTGVRNRDKTRSEGEAVYYFTCVFREVLCAPYSSVCTRAFLKHPTDNVGDYSPNRGSDSFVWSRSVFIFDTSCVTQLHV
jgi:hypothetical protein